MIVHNIDILILYASHILCIFLVFALIRSGSGLVFYVQVLYKIKTSLHEIDCQKTIKTCPTVCLLKNSRKPTLNANSIMSTQI